NDMAGMGAEPPLCAIASAQRLKQWVYDSPQLDRKPMAQRVQILLEDDIDGSDATQTIKFGLDGTNYEIDLNDNNAGAFRDAMAIFVGHARRVGKKTKSTTPAAAAPKPVNGTAVDKHSTREIRHWAQGQGLQVPARGRIPQEIRDKFNAAH